MCAVRFPTITELVQHGHNGMIFNNATELSQQIIELLFPNILTRMREVSSTSRDSINAMTGNNEEDLFTESSTLGGSEKNSLHTEDKVTSTLSNTTDHINYNYDHNHSQISLSALKLGAADIGSWDENWTSVLAPLIKSWI